MTSNTVVQTLRTGGISGYHLKLIALITMLIDHIGAVFVWRLYVESFYVTGSMQLSGFIGDKIIVWASANQELIYTIYEYMRLIGRIAFPIYCFLLVEGFLHTRSVAKYAIRLLLFAFISEIPFDMAIAGQWWTWEYSNVFFTLVIGLLLIWAISYVEKFYEFWLEKNWDVHAGKLIYILAGAAISIVMGGFAEIVLRTDYGLAGVFAILVIYLLRKAREFGFAVSILLLTVFSSNTEIVALLGLIPLLKYDGSRGKPMKYFFYVFYPAHLLLLVGLCMLLGIYN